MKESHRENSNSLVRLRIVTVVSLSFAAFHTAVTGYTTSGNFRRRF